jgi:hypothetical protein
MVVIMKYDMADNGKNNPGRRRKKTREKNNTHSTFGKQEYSDYHETTSRNFCHIYHSMARHTKHDTETREVQLRSGCNTVVLTKVITLYP